MLHRYTVTPSLQKIIADTTWTLGNWQGIPESERILPVTYIPMAYSEKVLSFIPFLNCWCEKVKCGGNLGVLELVKR